MNPLTLVKRIQNINSKEASLGISEDASWHAKYKDSTYVYVGGIPFDLTEGDLLAVFSQYGEIVDVNLVRDKGTEKSKGFAFVTYEDQRSTILAVDNLNGAQILGRNIRVDHVAKYKKRKKKRMKRQNSRKGRHEESVVLFREVIVPVELDAGFLIMSKEQQTRAGVLKKKKIQDGRMTGSMAQQGVQEHQARQIGCQTQMEEVPGLRKRPEAVMTEE